ncbi:hypothetical protein HPB49_024151 [Dermacentor silvarum]|uniref:Uncharacterized protein n=1 Tax=Dermacentor silvarum TaxID=543639 RepID=A0ACB8DLI0_DERSI|nr:hypothetical protein HPB49_024151 [Dermacentor silvarum]
MRGPTLLQLVIAAAFAAALVLPPCLGHVALTFPPARRYDLDFLDNGRTKGPCGMPKSDIITTLPVGATINVTWHLAYPHKGGFKLELLDAEEKHLQDLTPSSEFLGLGDATAQSSTVRLPGSVTCRGCSIRLLRQASEWGGKYLFWSCADVDLVPVPEFNVICSGHGRIDGGRCHCDHLYSGNVCQYKDECWIDPDCGPHGRCVNIDATSYPRTQCFCEMGWFGEGCSKQSPITRDGLKWSEYHSRKLSDNFSLYWKILRQSSEIEMVMKVKGTSYAAVGWRPKDTTNACKAFPSFPIEEKRSKRQAPTDTHYDDDDAEEESNFHPMDCTDIVVGAARGNLSRVLDMYTRDRSTPRTDAFYGGHDDLSAAFAYEEDGTTVVFFRKPLAANELSDQPLKNAPTLLIWAQGQEHGNYVHSPKTGLDEGHASVLDFYRPDELKYHGHKDQRGSAVINFHGETRRDPCQGEWRYPSTCRGDSCTYTASWLANPHTEEVSFEIRSKIADRWTGLGFSEDRRMPNTDAVIGWVEKNGRFFVYDMWLSGYKEPSNDVRSDLFNVSGEHADGMTTLRFARKFDTGDAVHDLAFAEGRCLHLVFPVAGGTYNSVLR